jgi:hypothetical protein
MPHSLLWWGVRTTDCIDTLKLKAVASVRQILLVWVGGSIATTVDSLSDLRSRLRLCIQYSIIKTQHTSCVSLSLGALAAVTMTTPSFAFAPLQPFTVPLHCRQVLILTPSALQPVQPQTLT